MRALPQGQQNDHCSDTSSNGGQCHREPEMGDGSAKGWPRGLVQREKLRHHVGVFQKLCSCILARSIPPSPLMCVLLMVIYTRTQYKYNL